MPEIFVGGTKYEDPRDLLDEYVTRLRAADPVNTLESSPIQGADQRNVAEMADLFRRLKEDAEKEGARTQITSKPMREDLDLLFRDRQDYLQSLDPTELKYFGDRLQDWSKESGLSIEGLNNQDFGGLQHEITSHYFPWQKGFSLDIQPKIIEGYRVAPNPATPLNELLATQVDQALISGKPIDLRDAIFSRSGQQKLSNFYNNLGEYAAAKSKQDTSQFTSEDLEDPRGKELLQRYNRFTQAARSSNPFAVRETPNAPLEAPYNLPPNLADVGLQLDEASKLLNWKYMDPLRQRYENLGKAQAPFDISRDFIPSWVSNEESLLSGLGGRDTRELRNLPTEETNYNRMLNLGQNLKHYLSNVSGRTSKYGGGANMLFGVDPLGATIAGASEALGNVKRNPSSLLPGAADLIPSPEAVRAGFKQGPVEMGKQMAKDFASSLPTAAVFAPILASPAVSPLAPGIGLGLVGTAAVDALNEVVRQQTGEGIVSKIRQAIGTRPRSGKASPGYKPPSAEYKPAQITKATPQAVANLEKQRTQNEFQRRMQLARERFNPGKGEFGLSEMLFGR